MPASIRAATALILALLLASCTGKPPVLSRVMGRVVYVHDSPNRETLSVYLVASDPDGMENLSAFYVINDDAELFWKVDSSAWVTAKAEGETWIGSSSLSMPGTAAFPAGEYRVLLEAKGGATVEDRFTLSAREVSPDKARYPAATIEDGTVKVTGAEGPYEIWLYGRDGKLIAAYPSSAAPVSLSTAPAGSTFRVFAWHAAAGYGALSGAYPVP